MAKESNDKPKLKVLDGALEVPQKPQVESLVPESNENVEVLKPDKDARFESKTFEPGVAEILPTEEEKVDTEAGWGESVYKAPPIGWFVLSGLFVVGLAFWASLSVFKARPEIQEVIEEKDELEQRRIEETRQVKATLKAMENVIQGYLAADSADTLIPHIRHPDRVTPFVKKYYQTAAFNPSEFDHIVRTRSLGIENRSFLRATVKLKDGGTRYLVLQQLDKESFRVDWESDVRYQPMSWDAFRNQRPPRPVLFRMLMRPDNYHVYEFRDEDQFDCYWLTVLSSEEHIYGFAKKGTEVARKLREYARSNNLTVDSKSVQPVMLKISFPKDTNSKKCVWIEEFVEPRWLFVESPGTAETE